ncbi:glycosyl transferase, family 2 [Acidisarcina polymorpha]|uniref:Glycosyl transferase, family 2 n=1 Tax=Acidisarcina polymorpha TaxID=2211140 RepID=A0A2Z5FWD5_9BACT|nr:glycosyltransferase family 39 protein [Acidisarcina polymorpha]AXC11040.1 glycosyl transferase, family 2 [Acidisarcina polymorpha]
MQWQALQDWFNPRPQDGEARFRPPVRIFWLGLMVRIAYMTLAHTYKVTQYEDHFEFGWEAARIARSLATGHGYSDPFILGGTGPTAWLPPVFPLMIAACFKLFGVYKPLAAWTVLALDCVFSAATALAVYEIAARCFNRRVAIWSGWLWALYPAAMQYAVKWVWETTLTTMLFAWVLVLALRVRGIGAEQPGSAEERGSQTFGRWLMFGLLWGLIALCNPSLLLFLPVCGVWMLWSKSGLRRGVPKAIASGLIFIACLAPWTCRNWKVFHVFIPIRGNFGAENWYGNRPDAQGFPWGVIIASRPDLQRYAEIGEVEYVKELGAKASRYIHEDPRHFARLTVKRVYFFWASVPHPLAKSAFLEYVREFHYGFLTITGLLGLLLALRRRVPASGLFACAFAILPATYYFVTVAARFRHPLEPLITVLTVYLFQSAKKAPRTGAQQRKANGVIPLDV